MYCCGCFCCCLCCCCLCCCCFCSCYRCRCRVGCQEQHPRALCAVSFLVAGANLFLLLSLFVLSEERYWTKESRTRRQQLERKIGPKQGCMTVSEVREETRTTTIAQQQRSTNSVDEKRHICGKKLRLHLDRVQPTDDPWPAKRLFGSWPWATSPSTHCKLYTDCRLPPRPAEGQSG